MTVRHRCDKKPCKRSKAAYLLYSYMVIFLVVLFFKNSSAASLWVSRGLSLCVTKLIPSLFPFMVLSSLVISSGAGGMFFHILAKPFGILFGIGENSISPLILGWLCGFPVGAKCAYEQFVAERIDKYEYNMLLCICSTPSPAFLIGAVGEGLLGDARLGIALYLISIISCLTVGVFIRLFLGKHRSVCESESLKAYTKSPCLSFTKAVSDAAAGMINVCAFVVFFSAFLGVLEGILGGLGSSELVRCTVFSFFELTSGISKISDMGTAAVLPMSALAVGWSGLSVHFQTISICTPSKCSFLPYLASQLAKALICFIISFVIF